MLTAALSAATFFAVLWIVTTERKNQAEAEYRFALTRVRENAESIALLGGDQAERIELDRSFTKLLARWRDLVGQHIGES